MPWDKTDDMFWDNDKILALSDPAFRLYVVARNWSCHELTDGHIPATRPGRLVTLRDTKKTVAELIRARLWHPADRPCKSCVDQRNEHKVGDPPDGGYLIHHFHAYQPAAWTVTAKREKMREIGAAGGHAKAAADLASRHSVTLYPEGAIAPRHSAAVQRSAIAERHSAALQRDAMPRTPVPRSPSASAHVTPGVSGADEPDVPDDGATGSNDPGARRRGGLRRIGEGMGR